MDKISAMKDSDREALIDICLAKLMECFDCVQILASYEEGQTSSTHRVFKGKGNWYARSGMAHDFINADKANTLSEKIVDALDAGSEPSDDPDDLNDRAGEGWKEPV